MKNTVKQYLSIIFCLCILCGVVACSRSKENIPASENIISQFRNVVGFEHIIFNGNGNLYISQGEEESVRIEGADTIIDQVSTLVVDKTLRIEFKKSNATKLIENTPLINVYVQVKSLEEIRLAGSGTITTTTPLKAHTLKVSFGGEASANIEIEAHKLISILSGSGKFQLKGIAENQDIWIIGAGIYDGSALVGNVANVNITGTGKVYLNVRDDLDVRIAGRGTVIYEGSPRVREAISGTGKIEQKK